MWRRWDSNPRPLDCQSQIILSCNFNFLRFTSINTCFKKIRKDNDFSSKFIMGASEGASETRIHKIVNKKTFL